MALDGIVSSPHRRSQNAQNAFSSSSSPSPTKKQYLKEEFGSCSVLLERHRFLLTALALLAFLCTIYLYFAVTLGAGESCSDDNPKDGGGGDFLSPRVFGEPLWRWVIGFK
ncbi:hypothetical protein CsSME_00007296 [Camellia sinensis var. sinensis]